jgi:UPF0755 protein
MKKKFFFLRKKYLVLSFACLTVIGGLVYYYFFSSFSSEDKTTFVYIDNDDDIDSVICKLRPHSSTHAMKGYTTLVRHSHYAEHIRVGRYALEPGVSTFNTFRYIKNGIQAPLNLTVPSVRTAERLAAVIGKKLMADSAAIMEAIKNKEIQKELGFDSVTFAAMVIPNTYDIYWTTTPEKFLKRLKKEYDAFWDSDRKGMAKSLGLTPIQVSTLASIIDEETANDEEKPAIAGMYLNRLHIDMPLQADPTIKFALKDFSLKRIYNSMLSVKSPYNTYTNTGLPPGPIRVPSVAGIDAVLNAEHHDYLYMCAKEDFSGTHNFARTYQEHLLNAAKYSKALNERGIK